MTYEEDIDGKSLFHIYCYAFEMEESPLKRRVMLALYSKNYAYSRIREFSTINSFSASAKIEFVSLSLIEIHWYLNDFNCRFYVGQNELHERSKRTLT